MAPKHQSPYRFHIKTVDDLVRDVALRNKVLDLTWHGQDVDPKKLYTHPANESDADVLALMEELKIVEPGWEDRVKNWVEGDIEFTFSGAAIREIADRIDGKNSLIRKKSLELISREIGNMMSGTKLVEFLRDCEVPQSLIEYPNTKWRMINQVMTYYATSKDPKDHGVLYKILTEATHPLAHRGEIEPAKTLREKINTFLQYDNLRISGDYVVRIKQDQNTQEQPPVTQKPKIKLPKKSRPHIIEDITLDIHDATQKPLKDPGHIALFIGVTDDNPVELQEKYVALKELQKIGAIKNIKTRIASEEAYYEDVGVIPFEVLYADIELDPKVFKQHLPAIVGPKAEYLRMLAGKYERILRITEIYLAPPFTRDEKMNTLYLRHGREFMAALDVNYVKGLQGITWLPISSLLSAESEAKKMAMTAKDILSQMNASFGRIHKELSRYDVSSPVETDEDLSSYLDQVSREKTMHIEKRKSRDGVKPPLQIEIVGQSNITVTKEVRKTIPQTAPAEPFMGALKKQESFGDLAFYNDGSIRYQDQILTMRAQIKDLCRMFIKRPQQFLTIDDIRDGIVDAPKRKDTSNETISKYVYELRTALKDAYGRDVIMNQKKEGWRFSP